MYSMTAAKEAWQQYEQAAGFDVMQARYAERWSVWAGDAYSTPMLQALRRSHQAIYANTSQVWSHSKGVVDFYKTHVYLGGISTDGKPLPDGTLGAIPIDPQVQTKEQAAAIRLGFAESCTRWNWAQKKSDRPKMTTILGNVLTELVDDLERQDISPQMVWPGYVKRVTLDRRDNVIAYTLEYRVTEEDERGNRETFLYRKEVDKEAFRYYRDDKPYDFGDGAVVPNPYGFVPAIWDRHETGWDEWGFAATDSTRQAMHMINSLLSHGIDHQRKVFFAPILVKGKVVRPGQTKIDLSKPPRFSGTEGDYSKPGNIYAETFDILAAGDTAGVESIQFDVGKTLDFLEMLKEGVLTENPEGSFYKELRSMGEVTAPGAERLLGDSASKCREARAGYDVQTIKLFQMKFSMAGFRIARGDWGTAAGLTRYQKAFLPFTDPDAFHKGEMDFGIMDRPVIIPTVQERLANIAMTESLQSQWGMEQAGVDPTVAAKILKARQDRYAFSVDEGKFGDDYTEDDEAKRVKEAA